jgi:hypothetical protein
VFKPCDETSSSLYLRRAVVTTAALDAEYGAGLWEGVVYHYNGQCNCEPYCGTWVCESDVIRTGPGINVCDPVPCDAVTAELPCPDCTDETYEDYVYVRPLDIPTRFTSVADCCATVCDNADACIGPLVDAGDCAGWVFADYTFHAPILTGASLSYTDVLGNDISINIDSYGVTDFIDDVPTKSRHYLMRVDYTVGVTNGETCPNTGNVPGDSSGWFYVTILVDPCDTTLPDQASCVATDLTVGFNVLSVPTDFTGRGNPTPEPAYPCGQAQGDVLRVTPWTTLTAPTYVVTEDECARYNAPSSVYYTNTMDLTGTFPAAGPTPAEAEALPARMEWEVKITYPVDPTP